MARHRLGSLAGLLLWLAVAPAAAQPAAADAPKADAHGRPAAQPGSPPPTWYAQALAHGAAGLNVTYFWSKGPKLRAETVVAGHKIVTIVSGDWYYAYDGLTGRGLAIRRDPLAVAKDAKLSRPFGNEYESLTEQGAELVRKEDVLGRKAGVFRVTDALGRREAWVTLDQERLPLRVEIYDRRTHERRTTDYLNWQSHLAIPDAFFQPDSIAKLEKISLEDYLRRTLAQGSVGPVPVLYANLLHVKRDE